MTDEMKRLVDEYTSKYDVVLDEHIYPDGSSVRTVDKRGGIIREGINYYLSNLWHDANEEPKSQSRIIIDYGSEPSIAGCYHGSTYKIDNKLYWYIYDGFVVKEVIPSKWCCFDDIFPYNNENYDK